MLTTKSEVLESSAFCLMPWIHLHISTRGLAQACCISPITFGDINKQSVSELWNSPQIKDFRLKLLRGEKDRRCNGCYQREASGNSSIRTETLEKFKHHIPQILKTTPDGLSVLKPRYLDIRFSNICNFRCITCWHGASSKWFDEAKEKGTNVADQAIIKAIDNEDNFFKQLDTLTPELEEVYFAGGEPLVMEQHYRLLDNLLNQNKTSIHLRYNTNISLLLFKNKNVIDYWNKFDRVTVSASIDAAGEEGEKIRRDSDWSVTKKNLQKVKQSCPHVSLEIAPTVSSLNILHLHDLHRELVNNNIINIDAFYFNILHRPKEYNIKTIQNKNKPQEVIEEYITWLQNNNASQKTINNLRDILLYMNT